MAQETRRSRRAGIWVLALASLLVAGLLAWGLGFWLDALNGKPWSFSAAGRQLSLQHPEFVLIACALPLLWIGVGISRTGLSWKQRLMSVVLRMLLLASLILGLGGLVEIEESDDVCLVALVDVSDSVSDAALSRAETRVRELASGLPEGNELRVLAFGQRVREVPVSRNDTGQLSPAPLEPLRKEVGANASDVAGALRAAAAWTGGDCLPRYHVMSDGIETLGDAGAEIALLRRRGVRVSSEVIAEAPPADVAVTELEIPDGVRVGEPFEVRVHLRATREVSGTLRLYQGQTLNGLDGVRKMSVPAGARIETFQSVVRVKGPVLYRAEFEVDESEQFPENNTFTRSIDVPGPPRVLLVDRDPSQATYLARALVAQQFDVDVRRPVAFPASTEELSGFEFVILSDVAREHVSRRAEELLEAYVRGGGGLLYAGGEAAYGPGGWQGSKLEKMLPVRMDAEKDREIPGVAMALVIDRSGSMTGLPLQMAKEACNATLSVLEGSDLIEVIAFDSRPSRYVKMQPARYHSRIQASVMRIQPGGGTEIFNSLDMAYQDLAAIEARKKHIVLLTDGNASSEGLYELATTAFAEGITITTVGLGGGANHELLRMTAEAGGGRFHEAADPSALPRIFTRETELVSKEAAVNDWFPAVVASQPQFTAGIALGAAPYLRGFTRTQMDLPPAELILATDTGEPLLARKRVGLGWTIAWTADLKARWAVDWLRWAQFGRFIGQLVRAHQLSDDTEIRPMDVHTSGRELVATVDAYDARERFDSSLQSNLMVTRAGNTQDEAQVVPFRRVAPGRYQARARLDELGAYSLKAVHSRQLPDGSREPAGVSFASVSLPYPDEYRELEPRPEMVRRWAQLGGGAFQPSMDQLFSAGKERITERHARQNSLILVALVLFLLDLLVRRVRIFDRKETSVA